MMAKVNIWQILMHMGRSHDEPKALADKPVVNRSLINAFFFALTNFE